MEDLIENMSRQGDVLIVPSVKAETGHELPRDADGSLTLAHGEVTGHRHRFVESNVEFSDSPRRKTRHLAIVKTTALLKHEEHTEIPVAPGVYDLPRQVEWTDSDEPRVVAD